MHRGEDSMKWLWELGDNCRKCKNSHGHRQSSKHNRAVVFGFTSVYTSHNVSMHFWLMFYSNLNALNQS